MSLLNPPEIIREKLLQISPLTLLLFIVSSSEFFTAIMSVVLGYLWWGRFDLDLFLIAAIIAGAVSVIVGGATIYFIQILRQVEKERLQGLEEKQLMENEQEGFIRKLAADFETTIGSVILDVSNATAGMQESASSMSHLVDVVNSHSGASVNLALETCQHVQEIAEATDRVSDSSQEIKENTALSAQVVETAVGRAAAANKMMSGLFDNAQKIDEVVEIITNIASQTRLLSLNATIEAARAGEAGKGFAVVANEVKELAQQTAHATQEIGIQIGSIQNHTRDAVKAIEEIGQTIDEISTIATKINSAVGNQRGTLDKIGGFTHQAVAGADTVAANIGETAQTAEQAGCAGVMLLQTTEDMKSLADKLVKEVATYMVHIVRE